MNLKPIGITAVATFPAVPLYYRPTQILPRSIVRPANPTSPHMGFFTTEVNRPSFVGALITAVEFFHRRIGLEFLFANSTRSYQGPFFTPSIEMIASHGTVFGIGSVSWDVKFLLALGACFIYSVFLHSLIVSRDPKYFDIAVKRISDAVAQPILIQV